MVTENSVSDLNFTGRKISGTTKTRAKGNNGEHLGSSIVKVVLAFLPNDFAITGLRQPSRQNFISEDSHFSA